MLEDIIRVLVEGDGIGALDGVVSPLMRSSSPSPSDSSPSESPSTWSTSVSLPWSLPKVSPKKRGRLNMVDLVSFNASA